MSSASSQALSIPLKIKVRRNVLGWSRDQVAHKTGLSLSTIENAESLGYTGSVSTLVSIASALGGEVVINFPEDSK
jgi:transcriptional regulator with XRE-family HTH domain